MPENGAAQGWAYVAEHRDVRERRKQLFPSPRAGRVREGSLKRVLIFYPRPVELHPIQSDKQFSSVA
jgi:hypothetical protein